MQDAQLYSEMDIELDTKTEREACAKCIYSVYIRNQAPHQINLSSVNTVAVVALMDTAQVCFSHLKIIPRKRRLIGLIF